VHNISLTEKLGGCKRSGHQKYYARVIGNLPLAMIKIKKEKILMRVARPWLLLQSGKPKLRYSNQAGMRLMTG
jgi:hypothetical protein